MVEARLLAQGVCRSNSKQDSGLHVCGGSLSRGSAISRQSKELGIPGVVIGTDAATIRKSSRVLEERTGGALLNEAAAKALLRWAAVERERWLEAVTSDPLLPARILPSD